MTSKAQITKIASNDGVDARVVERDYVLVHAVALISAHDTEHALVFKGGTALRKCYFGDYHFSEDLDFTAVGAILTGAAMESAAETGQPPTKRARARQSQA